MKFKTLTLSAATAALLATGAFAQDRPAADSQPTPPVATPDQPAAQKPMTGTESVTAKPATTAATTTKTTTESIQFTATAAAGELMTSQLIGTPVRNGADEKLGDINDIIVSKEGKPTVAVIGVGGFLGIGEKNVGVPFDSLQFTMNDQKKRIARLDVPKETLQAAPTFVYPEKTAALKTD